MQIRTIMLSLVMIMTGSVLAQTAKILGVSPKGYVVEVEGFDTKDTYLSVNVKLQYSQIAEEDAGCLVFVSKTPFPMVTNMSQIKAAIDKYDLGIEIIDETVQQQTSDLEVFVPFEHIKTTDKAQTLYLQAVVLHQDPEMGLLAKSQVMKVNAKDLSIIDVLRSEDDINKIVNLFSAAAGIASGGDGDCPNCHGKGEVEEKASYGSYTRQCYYCDGTGRDPASSEEDAGEESSGSILDLFFKKQTNKR